MRFHVTNDEAETLHMVLDFACENLRKRVGHTVMDNWDALAIDIARAKVRALRDKLYPDIDISEVMRSD